MKFNDLDNSTQVILKVIFAGLVLAFLWEIRDIILVLILALILASAMDPLVDYFKERRVPRSVSVLAVYILVLGLLALFSYLFIPLVVEQFKIFIVNLPQYSISFQNKFGSLFGNVDLSDFLGQQISSLTGGGNVVSSTFGIFNGFIAAVSVLIISFYLVAEEKGMKSFIGSLIPTHHQEFTLNLVEKIQKKMGLWILGQIIVSFIMFVTTWAGLLILHVPYALILGVIAGLLEVIPYIGPFLSAIPAIFIALLQSPALAVGVIILYLLLHELEGYILVPKIMEKTIGTSSLAILIALLVGFKLAGVVGLVISVPIAAAITVTINEFWPGKQYNFMSGEKEPGRDSEDFTAEELKEAHTDLFTDIYMQIYASFAKDYKTRHSEEEIARLEQDYQEFMIQIRTLTALQIRERFPQNIFAKKVIGVVVDILLEDKVLRQKVLSGEYDQFAIDSAKERAKEILKRRKN